MFAPLRKGEFSSYDWLSKWLRLLLKCLLLQGKMQTMKKETKDEAIICDFIETELLREKCSFCLWSQDSDWNEGKHCSSSGFFFFLFNLNLCIIGKCIFCVGIGVPKLWFYEYLRKEWRELLRGPQGRDLLSKTCPITSIQGDETGWGAAKKHLHLTYHRWKTNFIWRALELNYLKECLAQGFDHCFSSCVLSWYLGGFYSCYLLSNK